MRALVVGVDGQIGAALARKLAAECARVCGTSRRPGDRPGLLRLDLSEPAPADSLPDCDAVFLCAAETKMAICEAEPERTRRINALAPAELARHYASRGAFVVFLSSSAVFGGKNAQVRADAQLTPTTVYGQQKAEAERQLLALGAPAAVFRPTKVLTPEMPLLKGWIDTLSRHVEIRPFSDMVLSPLPVGFVTEALLRIARSRAPGIWQASGARDITYAEAASHLALRLGVPADLVRPVSAATAGIVPGARPPHSTLDASRLERALGLSPPDPFSTLDEVFGFGPDAKMRRGDGYSDK